MEHFFSIIIPSLNEEYNLPILLKSLATQTSRNFEVIINDSGSKDKTKEYAESFKDMLPSLNFITHPTKNVSMARNNGAYHAKGDWLVFFDADVEVEKDFIEGVEKHINDSRPDSMTVWNRPKNSNLQGAITLNLLNLSMTIFQKIKPAANGPCILMKKELFEMLKGFDDTIFFGEDFDIIQRAHKLGKKFAVFPKPMLYVSTRRFEKEGIFFSLYKSLKAIAYQLIFGPIRKPIFEYEMGGQYYKKKN
ncbi:MAG: glycosyltransferase [Patescibacteria group bacterium]